MPPFANHSIRVFLWMLLIVVPLGYCLLAIAADLSMKLGWYLFDSVETDPASQSLNTSIQAAAQGQDAGLTLLLIGLRLAPLWIAFFMMVALLFAGSLLVRRVRKQPLLKPALSNKQLAEQLLSVLFVAYLMGSCIHLISNPWFKAFELSSVAFPASEPEYWWPYYGWTMQYPALKGWTIYPPFDLSSIPMLPTAQAACVKLGTLLAILTTRYVWLRRQRTLHPQQSLKQQ